MIADDVRNVKAARRCTGFIFCSFSTVECVEVHPYKKEGNGQESIQSRTTPDRKVTKTQENTAHERAKRSAFSQQVITMLQRTEMTA